MNCDQNSRICDAALSGSTKVLLYLSASFPTNRVRSMRCRHSIRYIEQRFVLIPKTSITVPQDLLARRLHNRLQLYIRLHWFACTFINSAIAAQILGRLPELKVLDDQNKYRAQFNVRQLFAWTDSVSNGSFPL